MLILPNVPSSSSFFFFATQQCSKAQHPTGEGGGEGKDDREEFRVTSRLLTNQKWPPKVIVVIDSFLRVGDWSILVMSM